MALPTYIEDIFSAFAFEVDMRNISVQPQDIPAITSFQNTIISQRPLTQAQSSFVLRILQKYKLGAALNGIDYGQALISPIWKMPFRVLDNSCWITVDQQVENITILMKFPYALKLEFEKVFPAVRSTWDNTQLHRRIKADDINVIALHDFCISRGFDIDDTFTELCSGVEEIWNQEENFLPHAIIEDGQIKLINACSDAQDFFNKKCTGVLAQDMFLAKSMNFVTKMDKKELSLIDKITTTTDNYFYTKNIEPVFELIQLLPDPQNVVVVVDRTSDRFDFIKQFVRTAETVNFPKKHIRVCFRLEADENKTTNFNQWIKDNELNGPISTGKIFIFSHKPAKWLFTGEFEVKVIVTNNLYPSTSVGTSEWMKAHPCVIYVSASKPSLRGLLTKEITIVDL